MATFLQRDSGWWQAKIRRQGYPSQSRSFEKKAEADAWARQIETEMDRGVFVSRDEAERTTFRTLAERYVREVLPQKRGKEQDGYRIKVLITEFGNYSLAALSSSMIAEYRDKRLKTLAPQSVVHEINLLSRIFRTAVMDWGISLPSGIPTVNVRKPSVSNERTRRLVADEEARLLAAIDLPSYVRNRNPWTRPVVLLAIETAARQSELISMTWKDVNLESRVIRLRGVGGRSTKNDDQFRDVPLSTTAVAILRSLVLESKGKVVAAPRGKVFPTTASALKQSWERAVARARDAYEREKLHAGLLATGLSESDAECEIRKVLTTGGRKPAKPVPPRPVTLALMERIAEDPLLKDLHFHDLRHEATSRLADKLQLHELMKVTGHKGTRMLARYYHPKAEDLAKKLG